MIYQEDKRVYNSYPYEHELEVDLSAQQVKEARKLGEEQNIW